MNPKHYLNGSPQRSFRQRWKEKASFFNILVAIFFISTQVNGQITYHLGNSLTDTNNGTLPPITQSAGKSHTYLRSTIPGAPTDYLWGEAYPHPERNPPTNGANGEPDYRVVFNTRGPIDHLFTQPFAGHGRSVENEADYSARFFNLAKQESPNVQHWLYQQWPQISYPDGWSQGTGSGSGLGITAATSWETAVCNHLIYFEAVRQLMDDQTTGKGILIVPAGLALAKLKIEIDNGRVPGITNFFSTQYGVDDLHLSARGAYMVSLVHYACIYKETPVGRVTWKPSELTEEQAAIYRKIAWDVASDYPWSGMGGTGTLRNEICGTSSSPSDPPPTTTITGNVERELWTNVTGASVAAIPVNTAPTSKSTLTSLEGPVNSGDNYGARIRGYIVSTQAGWYKLYIAADDNAELWLSSGSNPADKTKVASVTGWTTSRQWNKYPSQQSSEVYLVSGGKFYFEILHKEASGGDNVAVAWTGPGITTPTVIGAANLDKFIPTDTQAPTAPSALTSPSKTSSSVSLSWTASTDAVGVTEYEVYVGSSTTAAVTATTTSATVTGLAANTAYSFTVKAKDAAGNTSAASNSISVTTNQATTGSNLALNRPTTTSSSETTNLAGGNAVDGNASTRWASSFAGDQQWIYVDLGSTTSISRVVLNWETAYASGYSVQTSNNTTSWTNIYTTTTGNGGIDDLTGLTGSGRYVRVLATAKGTAFAYSLWEIEVYGTGGGTSGGTLTKTTGTAFGTGPWTGCTTCTFDKAFDGNTATYFDANTVSGAYTGIDAGTARVVKRIRFYPRSSNLDRMVGGKFQGSNTSSSSGFVDLHTVTTQPTNAWQQVDITNTTGYRYLRYLAPANSYGNVAEVEFYYNSGSASREIAGGIEAAQLLDKDLNAYPNPSKDNLTVSYTVDSDQPVQIGLKNSLSQEVFKISRIARKGKNIEQINVTGFKSGLYFITIDKKAGKVVRKCIINN